MNDILEKYLNKKVNIFYASYAVPSPLKRTGVVTAIDKEFIELDNKEVILMKHIRCIEIV